MREHHIPVTRTARYYTLGTERSRPSQLWLACHGYGQLAATFIRTFEALADETILVAAPEALNRFYLDNAGGAHTPADRVGATWMTREDRLTEIDDYVRYLDALHAHLAGGPARAIPTRVLGFSQGAATAARWATFGVAPIDELILWGSFLPPELEPQRLVERLPRIRVTLVAGSRDRFVGPEVVAEHRARVERHGIACRVLTFEGGHRLDDATLRSLAAEELR